MRIHVDRLFNCEFAFLSIFANGLVDAAIGSATDKSHDVIFIAHTNFAGISSRGRFSRIYIVFESATTLATGSVPLSRASSE